MRKELLMVVTLLSLLAPKLHADQSMITEADGYACMGEDKSRKQTEQVAFQDAKQKASEAAMVHIQSETQVKDGMLEKDLVVAYTKAKVRIVQELEKKWSKEEGLGDCFRVRIMAEVVPDEKALAANNKSRQNAMESDPAAPLLVQVWTDKKEYRQGEKIKIYLKGNKPFFGRVVYRDAAGDLIQLLPNPYRGDSYFNGGAVYELPSGDDRYDMEVTAPFGSEGITVYASTAPQGNVDVEAAGGVFGIKTKASDVAVTTRGVKLMSKGSGKSSSKLAEFSEAKAELRTEGE